MITQSLLALAATISSASAVIYRGFNYFSMQSDGKTAEDEAAPIFEPRLAAFSLLNLPTEILLMIIAYTPSEDEYRYTNLRRTCRTFQQLFSANKGYLTRNIVATQLPITALVLDIDIDIDTVTKLSYASRVAKAIGETSETVLVSRNRKVYEMETGAQKRLS